MHRVCFPNKPCQHSPSEKPDKTKDGIKTLEVSPETYGMLKSLAKYAGLSKEEMLLEMVATFVTIRQGYQRIAGDFSCCAFGGSCYDTEMQERKSKTEALNGQRAKDGEIFHK